MSDIKITKNGLKLKAEKMVRVTIGEKSAVTEMRKAVKLLGMYGHQDAANTLELLGQGGTFGPIVVEVL